jgi:SSS family solute:Na+ symporter
MEKTLNSVQVAALLVSASYGIGFLFGSGELALAHGMAGSIYGLATAAGMLLMTVFAARLWRSGVPIWDLFGEAHGPALKNAVALLSMVWMAGVLAAQIHGGVAIMKLLGIDEEMAYAIVLGGILVASRLNLRIASTVFSLFLIASGLVLVYVLFSTSGAQVYAQSPMLFARDLSSLGGATVFAIVVAVVALVCAGADYHQFLLAARTPSVAVRGCLLAGITLVALSFLPASVVVGLSQEGALAGLADSKQVIPFAISHAASTVGLAAVGSLLLVGVSAAALGSGAAIVRAMSSALTAATSQDGDRSRLWPSFVALAAGGALAARGQGIVETMVSVNVIYIASIGWTFGCLVTNRTLSPSSALRAVVTGLLASSAVYVVGWLSASNLGGDLTSLAVGLVASGLVLLVDRRRVDLRSVGP